MKDEAAKAVKKYFGTKVYSGIVLIGIGAFGWWWISNYFISKNTFAEEKQQFADKLQSEKEKFVNTIKFGDNTQRLQIMYLRLDLVKKNIEEAEDQLDKNPASGKWKSRIEERKMTRRTIEKKIDEINRELNETE